jgi:hypothetical protein
MFSQSETFICVNLRKSADKSGLPFTLSSGKSENNNPKNPVDPVKIKNIGLAPFRVIPHVTSFIGID